MDRSEKWVRVKYLPSEYSVIPFEDIMSNRDFYKWLEKNKKVKILKKYYFYIDIEDEE